MCKHNWSSWEARNKVIRQSEGWFELSWFERHCRVCKYKEISEIVKRYVGQ